MTRETEDLGPVYPAPGSKEFEDSERFVAGGVLEVPWRTRVEGEWLVYERGDRDRFDRHPRTPTSIREGMNASAMNALGLWHYRAPSAKLLTTFVGLAAPRNPERVAEGVKGFADRYGVLNLCPDHRLPASHNPGIRYFNRNNVPACFPYDMRSWKGKERIEDWVRFARLASSVRNIALRLHSGAPGRPEDWKAVMETVPTMHYDDAFVGRTVAADWFHVRWVINAWLAISSMTLTLREVGARPLLLRFDASKAWGTLFGTLGFQLLLSVSSVRGMAICAECGDPYEVSRKVDPTRDNFCPKHQHVALQRAKARDRAAQLEILRLARSGVEPRRVASQLGTTLQRVKRVIRASRVT